MKYFNLLKAKHWQIFLFFYGLSIFYQIGLVICLGLNTSQNKYWSEIENVVSYIEFAPLILMLFILSILYWFWSVVVELNNKLSVALKLQTKKFKFFVGVVAFYFTSISLCIWVFIESWGSEINLETSENDRLIFFTLALFFIISLTVMLCLFYCFYFVAKTIKTTELKRKVNFNEFIIEFLLIWFLFPIGIWFIQPRINKLMKYQKIF